MANLPNSFIEEHNIYYRGRRKSENEGRIVSPGSQYMIHLMKGGYLGDDYREGRGRKVLDVGCGSGFNCVSFAMMGWEVYGVEITESIVEHTKTEVKKYGFDAEILVGENENIPYPDSMFDLLISMNVIHYVQSKSAVRNTIQEYGRVLKGGGRIFLSTNHPENWLLDRSTTIDKNRVRLSLPGDYRDGQILFVFNSQRELQEKFSPYFRDILLGENRFDFFTRILRHWILTAAKK